MEKKETLSEEVKEFNPESFAGLDKLVETVGQVGEEPAKEESSSLVEEDNVEESTVVEDALVEDDSESDDSDFDWGSESLDEPEEEQILDKEDDDWDVEASTEVEEETEVDTDKEQGVDWDSVANELGLEGASKEDIIKALNSKNEPEVSNDATSKYEGYLKLSDRELLSADMKATGMDEYDVDDSLDRMEDSGMLKHEALKIRKQLKNAIRTEKTNIKSQEDSKQQELVEAQQKSRKELQTHLKSFDNYLGGKVTVEQRKDLYKYITTGNFNEDIYKSHANVAEAAFLWKNRQQIQKLLKSQGFEEGKGSVLDNLTNKGGRGNSKPKYKTGAGFDASAFMGE